MSCSSTNSFSSPPMFNGENYDFWAIRMKAFLKGNDVWEVIEHGFQLPFPQENPTVAQMKRNAEYNAGTYRALSFLHNAVANDIFPKIASCQNAQEVWEALKEEYEGSARDKSVTLLALKREFEMLKMKETDTIRQYSSKLVDLVTQIRMQGERFPDSRVVDKMLVSLPERFEPKVAAIEESCDLSRLSVKALTGKLQAHEKRLAMRSDESVEGAFQAKHKGKYLVARSDWQQEAGSRKLTKWRKANSKLNVLEILTRETNFLLVQTAEGQITLKKTYRLKQVQQANFIEDQNEEDYMFVAMHSCFVTSEDSWYVDSGCTNHMVKDVKLFTKLDRSIRTRVRLGNGYVVQAEGKGNVSIQTKEGIKTITDVLYIPSLSQNLLSVTQLMKHGYSVHFKQDVCQIFDLHGSEVANVKMVDNSFPLMWSDVKQHVLISKEDETTLWHRRYGHCNVRTLKFLQSSQLFGSGVFCWNSCKQEVVAQSTAEAEYISAVEASNHAIWLRKMLSDMGQPQFDPSLIYVDNTSTIAIAQNPVQHKRTKHVHVKYHVIRQYIKNKQIQLLHCSSDVQLADILTKSLPKQRFKMLREQLGVTRLALKEEC
ncbi:hypothetical protein SLEP1_g38182 [Rubroshorea leprosula]|uniref:Retrovirus-related Pol polyprotein from transposon TNT 1-94-like beta-barrel domain-containing protein n=1 Tax=Rubroshorea leprosula TaxID=152421 RepID=A0AAV5KXM5_9ROSI|nr:hypothetical protein SLEP1_g38182 [Rubroshorea leprosula]